MRGPELECEGAAKLEFCTNEHRPAQAESFSSRRKRDSASFVDDVAAREFVFLFFSSNNSFFSLPWPPLDVSPAAIWTFGFGENRILLRFALLLQKKRCFLGKKRNI